MMHGHTRASTQADTHAHNQPKTYTPPRGIGTSPFSSCRLATVMLPLNLVVKSRLASGGRKSRSISTSRICVLVGLDKGCGLGTTPPTASMKALAMECLYVMSRGVRACECRHRQMNERRLSGPPASVVVTAYRPRKQQQRETTMWSVKLSRNLKICRHMHANRRSKQCTRICTKT